MDIKELRVGNTIWRPCCYDKVVEIRENGSIGNRLFYRKKKKYEQY